MRPAVEAGLVEECEDLYAVAQTTRSLLALAGGLDIGLEPIEDFPGSLVSRRYHSSWHSIKRNAKMVASFRRTMLL
jgi:hypothetical protein